MKGGALTADEQTTRTNNLSAWASIKSLRTKSDEIEGSDLKDIDITDDQYWSYLGSMDSGNRALVEALMRRQLPALFGKVETSTEPPPARDPWVVRAAQSPVADSIMNAFTGTAEGVADAVTLPGDVLSGSYSLPPSDTPGISEDDGYNVCRDNQYIGNRLANQEGMIRRATGLGGTFTGSGVATTAAQGRKGYDGPECGSGGRRRAA